MKERLEELRRRLGIQWRELADMLEISVPMVGCLRRGERNPSEKLLARIADVEAGRVVLHAKKKKPGSAILEHVINDRDILLKRIADLEAQLATAMETINNQSKALAQGRSPSVRPPYVNANSVRSGGKKQPA